MSRPSSKKQQIEAALVEVVIRKGLSGTSIQDIAQEAGVSPALLYQYWRDRDELAGAVYRRHFHELMERLTARAEAAQGALAKLEAMADEFLRLAEESPRSIQFILLSQHDLYAGIPREEGLRVLIRGVIDSGVDRGEIRKMDVDLAVQLYIGIVIQPVIGRLYGAGRTAWSAQRDGIVGAVRRLLSA